MGILIGLLLLAIDTLPTAQVQIHDFIAIYAEPDAASDVLARARDGDVLLIYETRGRWGRTDSGWLLLTGLTPEPAVAHYSAVFTGDLELASAPGAVPDIIIPADSTAGVTAIFDGYALVYSESGAGWVSLSEIELSDPTPNLLGFVEQTAYVKTEAVDIFTEPNPDAESRATLLLGREVTILYQTNDWVLLRSGSTYGWSRAASFDFVPRPVARGDMNAGPVNLRRSPVNGTVLTVLGYLESILLIGRNDDGTWLYVRQPDGFTGWVAAQYVNFDGEIDDLPLIAADQ